MSKRQSVVGWRIALRELDRHIVLAKRRLQRLETVRANWMRLRDEGMQQSGGALSLSMTRSGAGNIAALADIQWAERLWRRR